jgi:hypothetical protein
MAFFNLVLDRETREAIADMAESQAGMAESLAGIRAELRVLRFRSGRPGVPKITFLREDRDMIQFKVVLPEVADSDVVSRELSVKIGEGEPDVRIVAAGVVEVEGFEGPQNAPVVLSLLDIDDAENRSEPSTLETVLADTFPPAKPGELSLVATGETSDE